MTTTGAATATGDAGAGIPAVRGEAHVWRVRRSADGPWRVGVLAALPRTWGQRLWDRLLERFHWASGVMGRAEWNWPERFVSDGRRWHRVDGDGRVGRAVPRRTAALLDRAPRNLDSPSGAR